LAIAFEFRANGVQNVAREKWDPTNQEHAYWLSIVVIKSAPKTKQKHEINNYIKDEWNDRENNFVDVKCNTKFKWCQNSQSP
jgi:hypothetical protein